MAGYINEYHHHKRKKNTVKKNPTTTFHSLTKLHDPNIAAEFQAIIGEKCTVGLGLPNYLEVDLNNLASTLDGPIQETANDVRGKQIFKKLPWVPDETLNCVIKEDN